jgi:signal transduction histidine kinase/ActR/RegA family two-component response regulator
MKESIEQIKSINHHLRLAIEQVGEGVLIIEPTSHHPLGPEILFANGRVVELTGYPKEALLDQPIGLIYEPERLNGLVGSLAKVGESGKVFEMKRDAVTRTGERLSCQWTISGVRDIRGEVVNYILTLSKAPAAAQPLTVDQPSAVKGSAAKEPKLDPTIEESIEKSRVESLALLAGGIAHDFNNVLQTILTNLSLAKLETPYHNSARQHIDDALDATQDAQLLVRQILDFTKGREPKIEVVNLGDALKRVAKLATMGTRIKCDTQVPDGLWGVEVDVRQIRQVIHNLMVNACQAMPGGGVIQAWVQNEMITDNAPKLGLSRGPYVVIRVRDRGCGIADHLLPRIFEPDFTTKENGNGIGLATCRAIVQRHRGAITVTSRVNVGTEFRVFLPACQILEAVPERPVHSDHRRPGATTAGSGQSRSGALPEGVISGFGRVLVVDDQDSVREAAERLLKKIGYDPISAASGQEAVILYRQYVNTSQPFNAVLLDMTLPGGLSGDEVMTEIQKVDRNARVIATSGYFADDAETAFRRDGYVGILPKPYAVEKLSEKLAEAIQN